MFAIATIDDWAPDPGSVVCWHASAKAVAAAARAPVGPIPPSYQQVQHLRRFADHARRGLEMSRLMFFTWDVAGQCDVRAMTYVLNTHLRRHDTYRSWFEYRSDHEIVRRTIADPADIAVSPHRHGDLGGEALRDHILDTPDLRQWDGFRFGVIQRADHFTFYASIAHLYTDASIIGVLFGEFHLMYRALAHGAAPVQLTEAGSYEQFCRWQHEYTASLTGDDAEVKAWLDFAGRNGGTLPDFPLPLGDLSMPCSGQTLSVTLLDELQTHRFEQVCARSRSRFSGGVFACAALAAHELTGAGTFHVVTPTDTRRTPKELLTTGWFTGLVPVTVPVAARSFGDTARMAQDSYDANIELAKVPFDRVMQLAPAESGITSPRPGNLVMSFLDASIAPLSTVASSDLNFRIYNEGRASHQVSAWITRLERETSMTALFPDNAIARSSVARFVEVMKSVYVRVAEGRWSGALMQDTAV